MYGKPVGCPNCNSERIETIIATEHRTIGLTGDTEYPETTVDIPNVPHRRCIKCAFEYFDYAAEEVIDRYVTMYWRLQQVADTDLNGAILNCIETSFDGEDYQVEPAEPAVIRKELLALLGTTPVPVDVLKQ